MRDCGSRESKTTVENGSKILKDSKRRKKRTRIRARTKRLTGVKKVEGETSNELEQTTN